MTEIKRVREARGWSRAELARRANLNATTVSLIENGRLLPYPLQLEKLARALGVEPQDLQGETAMRDA